MLKTTPSTIRRILIGLSLASLLLTAPWFHASVRYALASGANCDIWRQWTVCRYLNSGVNPYAVSLGILEKNFGVMTGESRKRLKELKIYEVHPSWDSSGVAGFSPEFGAPTSTYPPSSLLFIDLMGAGWIPGDWVHVAWLALNMVFLLLLMQSLHAFIGENGMKGTIPRSAVLALLLLWPPVHESIRTLQFIIPVTWFLFEMLSRMDRQPLLAGLFLAAALIKPSASLPFVLLPLIRGRWQTVALAGAIHLAATVLVGLLVQTPPLDLLRDWLKIPGYMLQGAYSIQEVINGLGWDNTKAGLALSLGFAAASGIWALAHRKAGIPEQAAFLAMGAVLWTYHERYDFVLILIPIVLLMLFLKNSPRRGLTWAMAAGLIVLGAALTDAVYLFDAPALRVIRWLGRASLVLLLVLCAESVRRSHSIGEHTPRPA